MRVCIHIVELPRYGCNHEPLKSRKLEWPHLSVYIGNVLSLILTLSRFVDGKKIRSKFNDEKNRNGEIFVYSITFSKILILILT